MKKLFLGISILFLTTSCDITDYFMDESGVVKHKDGTTVDQKEINSNTEAVNEYKSKRPGMTSYSNITL
jgi:hypothetical protein